MQEELNDLPKKAREKEAENRAYFKKLRKKKPKQLDGVMDELHNESFDWDDCLVCANCCKTTGPLYTQKDIERIAKSFKMKPSQFIDQYLRLDEENDYVLQELPCPFLDSENYCLIYDIRPKACREYPHTDRRKFYQISSITMKNIPVCPATYKIVEELKKKLPL